MLQAITHWIKLMNQILQISFSRFKSLTDVDPVINPFNDQAMDPVPPRSFTQL